MKLFSRLACKHHMIKYSYLIGLKSGDRKIKNREIFLDNIKLNFILTPNDRLCNDTDKG